MRSALKRCRLPPIVGDRPYHLAGRRPLYKDARALHGRNALAMPDDAGCCRLSRRQSLVERSLPFCSSPSSAGFSEGGTFASSAYPVGHRQMGEYSSRSL